MMGLGLGGARQRAMLWPDLLGRVVEQLAQVRDIFGAKLLRRNLTHAMPLPIDMISKVKLVSDAIIQDA
jgi:hypothetical protein